MKKFFPVTILLLVNCYFSPVLRALLDLEKGGDSDNANFILLLVGVASQTGTAGNSAGDGSPGNGSLPPGSESDDPNQPVDEGTENPQDPTSDPDPQQDPPPDPDPPATPAILLTESGGTTTATEGGAGDSFTMVLSTQPIEDVSITVTAGSQVLVNGLATTNIVFTPSNWNISQTINVSAFNDSDVEGAHSGVITHESISDDPNYNAISIPSVTVAITDNNFQVATPVITAPSPGHYNTPQSITITTTTPGATIHYTIDGTTPTTASPVYRDPIGIWSIAGRSINLRALGVAPGGQNSDIAGQAVGVYSTPPLQTGADVISGYSLVIGEDANTRLGLNRSYTDNGNGTITDNATGLVWQKCSRGQNSMNCSGTATTVDWIGGRIYCNSLNLAGKKWRLPTVQELESIVDYGRTTSPMIDTAFFPLTAGSQYWTSTEFSPLTTTAIAIFFNAGVPGRFAKSSPFSVRCVSGVSRGYVGNFTDNGDGTVSDNSTGLVWQKCSRGQNPTDCSGEAIQNNWSPGAISYCNSLGLASRSWRIPNINEFKSIVDTTQPSAPMIDSSVFPNIPPVGAFERFWTSTTHSQVTNRASTILFLDGFHQNVLKSSPNFTRCVSGP